MQTFKKQVIPVFHFLNFWLFEVWLGSCFACLLFFFLFSVLPLHLYLQIFWHKIVLSSLFLISALSVMSLSPFLISFIVPSLLFFLIQLMRDVSILSICTNKNFNYVEFVFYVIITPFCFLKSLFFFSPLNLNAH